VKGVSGTGRIAILALVLWVVIEIALFISLAGDLGHWLSDRVLAWAVLTAMAGAVVVPVLFLIWLHDAMTRAHELGWHPAMSPGWAVGWFFVPVASLWKPYQVMIAVWESSGNTDDGRVGRWWTAWLFFTGFTTLIWVAGPADGNLTNGQVLCIFASSLLGAITAIMLALIIRKIDQTQKRAIDTQAFD